MYGLDVICFDERFRFDLEFMLQCAGSQTAIVVVAELGQAMFGFIIAELRRGRARTSAYITTLDVDPGHRRKGLAGKLMAEAERRSFAAGATRIRLHVWTENTGALRFYEARGYVRGRRRAAYYGAAGDAWSYGKYLARGCEG